MLKSKEWPISKIYRLAKLHVNIIDGLRPLYLENLQDKHQMINKYGDSLLQGFLNATISALDTMPLFHSMHNMCQGRNKVLLTHTWYFDIAVEYLGTIHETLYSNIDTVYHPTVFSSTARIQLIIK